MAISVGDVLPSRAGGRWHEVTIKRLNADGTVDAVPVGSQSFLDKWESISRAELSPDDAKLWTTQFARLAGPGFGRAQMHAAIASLGANFPDEAMHKYWADVTGELFGSTAETTPSLILDETQAYKLILRSGYSARTFAEPPETERSLYRLYWNGVRMGGRDPGEVAKAITLADVYDALGLDGAAEDPNATAALLSFEQHHEVRIPTTLRELFTRVGCLHQILSSHCNNPEPQAPGNWVLNRELPELFGGESAVRIVLPHQGDHAWWAVFADGAEDARIAISFEEDAPPVRLVSASLPFFFWDLRQSGKNWEEAIADKNVDAEDDDEPKAKAKAKTKTKTKPAKAKPAKSKPTKTSKSKPKSKAKAKATLKSKAKPSRSKPTPKSKAKKSKRR